MSPFTEKDLLSFLDTISKQNIIPKNTADAQKAAIIKVLSSISEEEKNNLNENLDLEHLFQRFENFAKHDLSPSSLETYKARFKTAFSGFLKWTKSPSNYKAKTRGRPQKSDIKSENNPSLEASYFHEQKKLIKFNIPIQPEIFGQLELPHKLSKLEANRINTFVSACINSLLFEQD